MVLAASSSVANSTARNAPVSTSTSSTQPTSQSSTSDSSGRIGKLTNANNTKDNTPSTSTSAARTNGQVSNALNSASSGALGNSFTGTGFASPALGMFPQSAQAAQAAAALGGGLGGLGGSSGGGGSFGGATPAPRANSGGGGGGGGGSSQDGGCANGMCPGANGGGSGGGFGGPSSPGNPIDPGSGDNYPSSPGGGASGDIGRATNVDFASLQSVQGNSQGNSTAISGAQQNNAVVMDFMAEWCGPCQAMSGTVHNLQNNGTPIIKVDGDQNQALANALGVTGYPTFVAGYNDPTTGKFVETGRIVGGTSAESLRALHSSATEGRNTAETKKSEAEAAAKPAPEPAAKPTQPKEPEVITDGFVTEESNDNSGKIDDATMKLFED